MSRAAATRYPLEPLLALEGGDVAMLAARLRVHPRQVYRWLAEGVPDETSGRFNADRLAVELGHHPSEVWTDWHAHAPVAS